MGIFINLSKEVRTFITIFNSVACAIFVIIRVYHQKKYHAEVRKISWTGLSCIFVGLLCCSSLANGTTDTYFGDADKWCVLTLKLNTGTYTLHRVLLYMFIILRLQVVNQFNIMNARIIYLVKMAIGTTGTCMVVLMVVSTDGIIDQVGRCTFQMKNAILIPLFLIDIIVCSCGTYMFIRPLKRTLSDIECENIAYVLKRTTTWSLVSLGATLMTMLIIAITDGVGIVVSLDCSINSFSLVMMLSPGSPQKDSKRDLNLEKNPVVEIQEKQVFSKGNPL